LPLPYSDLVTQGITAWKQDGIELLAPTLLEYEVGAALRKVVVADLLTTNLAAEAMRWIAALNIQCLPPTLELHERALHWSDRLGYSKTYDAHYLALAEPRQTALWTADKRLANGARQAGATWVHWIGEQIPS
jgi:predicted nucleic acid-binding protein